MFVGAPMITRRKKGATSYELRAWHEEIVPVLEVANLMDGLALIWRFWMSLEFIEIMITFVRLCLAFCQYDLTVT
jgi:hypothetical protein